MSCRRSGGGRRSAPSAATLDGSWLWSNDGPWRAGISDVEVGSAGGGSCSAEQGCVIPFIEAFETTNGTELWHLDLNEIWDPEFRSVTWDHARVSADSRRAYFTGFILGAHDAGDERSLLWAIDLVDPDIFSDGFESGDTAAWSTTTP